MRHHSCEVRVGDDDPARKPGVDTGVFQVGGLLGVGVKQALDVVTLAGIVRVAIRPNGFGFDNQCFAIRVKRVGHGRDSSCKD
jgi:hypothetical protein